MKPTKTIIGVAATMGATQSLLFWIGAIDRPLWLVASMALYGVGLWCFADSSDKEEAR